MALAHRAGIQIFVTGGIGGVHRGAETSMDISADLYELSHTPLTVISAGVKSILDIGRTLEYLETLGVCVATYGDTREFPSFFTPRSKYSTACNVTTHAEAASLIDSRDRLELESGILIAVPIPDKFSEDGYKTETVIEAALKEAREKNVLGRDVTPFVLNKVRELSGGASLKANIGLLENNALHGSLIAVQLNALQNKRTGGSASSKVMMSPFTHGSRRAYSTHKRPVVIGGSVLDIHVKALEDIKVSAFLFWSNV
ncbi:hypothetical protein JTE90_014590 [Oedothorax gibbosus]|uniref:Pseudouridine-5'-phosphate glycosidase n=1 Tax=Oedothorax gibbosus TaxID=931172 RepID=A0AAV6UPB9_9ARAC|nr:hypothetical protein JTE90_014590 [Oedothorax gibbosus]